MIQGTGVQVSDVAHEPFYFKNWAEFRGAIKFKGIKLFCWVKENCLGFNFFVIIDHRYVWGLCYAMELPGMALKLGTLLVVLIKIHMRFERVISLDCEKCKIFKEFKNLPHLVTYIFNYSLLWFGNLVS